MILYDITAVPQLMRTFKYPDLDPLNLAEQKDAGNHYQQPSQKKDKKNTALEQMLKRIQRNKGRIQL